MNLLLGGIFCVALATETSSERKFQIGGPTRPKPVAADPAPVAAAPPKKVLFEGPFDVPPSQHWSVRLPGGRLNAASHTERSGPVIVGDRIFIGSAAGRALYALSRRDGSVKREYPALGPVQANVTVVEDRLYFGDTGGRLWCYQLDGTALWHFDTGAPILVEPTVVGNRVYVTNVRDLAVAVDTANGELVWQYQRKPDLTREAELALFGKPPAVVDGDRVILGFSDGAVVVLDRERGEELWSRRVGEGRYPDLVAAPFVHENTLYSAGYYAPFMALDPADGSVRWRAEVGAAWAPLAVDRNGGTWIFHPGVDGKLRAYDAATGTELWTWYSGTSGALTTPILTDAGLLVGSSEGTVSLVNPDTGRKVWDFSEGRLLAGISSMPAVEGRQLTFVSNAGILYSLWAREETPVDVDAGTLDWRRRSGP